MHVAQDLRALYGVADPELHPEVLVRELQECRAVNLVLAEREAKLVPAQHVDPITDIFRGPRDPIKIMVLVVIACHLRLVTRLLRQGAAAFRRAAAA